MEPSQRSLYFHTVTWRRLCMAQISKASAYSWVAMNTLTEPGMVLCRFISNLVDWTCNCLPCQVHLSSHSFQLCLYIWSRSMLYLLHWILLWSCLDFYCSYYFLDLIWRSEYLSWSLSTTTGRKDTGSCRWSYDYHTCSTARGALGSICYSVPIDWDDHSFWKQLLDPWQSQIDSPVVIWFSLTA